MSGQLDLFGVGAPTFDEGFGELRRTRLDATSWVDFEDRWLSGHWEVFRTLVADMRWQEDRRPMYDRIVDVPRLTARVPRDGPGHAVLEGILRALSAHYRYPFDTISLAYYRDGGDSVAMHGDRIAREAVEAIVAIVSLGEPRRFLLKPAAGGPSRRFRLGWGDLLVMGGRCQRDWRHGIPKTGSAGPRISVQFR